MRYRIEANSEFAKSRFEKLYIAANHQNYTDVKYTVRNRSIYAHMVVLSICSEIFIKQSVEYVNNIFKDFDDVVIDAIFKFCYTGIIDTDKDLYEKFKILATQLQITTVYYETIDEKNCLEVLTLSNDPKSIETAIDLILLHFEKLYLTKDFLRLPITYLIEIIKSDYLNVSSEMHVLKSIKMWVEEDDQQRKAQLQNLLGYVKLPALTMEINFTDVLSNYYSSQEYKKIINETVESILSKKILNTDRRWKIEKIALVGTSEHANRDVFEIYDCKTNKWNTSKHFDVFRSEYASTVVDDLLLIIGGSSSAKVVCINLIDGKTRKLKQIHKKRWRSSAVTISDKSSSYVYVMGGYTERNVILSSVERWNSKKEMQEKLEEKWDMNVAPMNLAVAGHSSVVIGDTIYVMGGRTNDNNNERITNKLQIYSTNNNSWSFCTPMNQRREGHSSVIFNGYIYVAGGSNSEMENIDSVEYYNPRAKTWTNFIKLAKPLYGLSLCAFRNKLLCIGGKSRDVKTADVFEYDDTNRNWEPKTSLGKTRFGSPLMAHVIPYKSDI
ncbi:kelch-like protein 7 [Arctopsyche grandis]|uniref:kelch-like protein 7 n=1 Tax=Arctopsyche grandis TaxID=121162 RepID=UPI00406D7FD6